MTYLTSMVVADERMVVMNAVQIRRPVQVRWVVLTVLLVVAALAAGQWRWGVISPRTFEIHASNAFDVENPEQLKGFSDFIVVADVVDEGGRVKDLRTNFTVEVAESIKGELPGTWTVSQLGYVDGRDEYVSPRNPRLEVGKTYLLALAVDVDGNTLNVLPGNLASQPITGVRSVDSIPLASKDTPAVYPPEMDEFRAQHEELRTDFLARNPGTS